MDELIKEAKEYRDPWDRSTLESRLIRDLVKALELTKTERDLRPEITISDAREFRAHQNGKTGHWDAYFRVCKALKKHSLKK